MKTPRTEQWLARLRAAAEEPGAAALCLEALRAAPGPVVARAMGLLRRLGHDGHAEEAREAFARLCREGRAGDPGCAGRRALAEGLLALDWSQSEPWWTGVTLVQWEPVFGGRVDAAAGLRGLCALGLARAGDARAPLALARLLADPEAEARRGAVRALREAPASWALPLLAHRALLRAEDLDGQLELFHGLLEREDPQAFALVAGFLDEAWEEGREAAAIALGERGGAEGAHLLWAALEEELLPQRRRPFWLGLALSRCEEGRGLLLARLPGSPPARRREAAQALEGLHDEELSRAMGSPPSQR